MNQNDHENEKQKQPDEDIAVSNAAKVLAALDKEPQPVVEEAVPVGFAAKLSNFWYHHKWKVIIISAFAFIFISVGTQFVTKGNPDIRILCAGPLYFTPNQSGAVSTCLYDLMDDYNGDGEKKIAFNDIVYMTADQIREAQADAEAHGEEFALDRQSNAQTAEQFTYEVMAGDCLLCFLAPDQYQSVADAEAFVPLTEIFEVVPEGAVDAYGLRLCETKFYKYYTAVQVFGEDTIVALKRLTTVNQMKGEKMEKSHADHMDLFRKIGTFEYPEGYTPPSGEPVEE